jgi:hypothetical protein
VLADVVADTPVIELAMLRKSRLTPLANVACSRRSVPYAFTTRMPPSVSLRRPVTSPWILPRSRKIGRRWVNARAIPKPNTARMPTMTSVIVQLSQSSTPSASSAVTTPPTSCTMPVPTRLRIPSASFITREIITPVWCSSK